MDKLLVENSDLVTEIVGDLLAKFEQKPSNSKRLIALSSIEAVAMITAMEARAHIKRNQLGIEQMQDRIKKYSDIFTALLGVEMRKLAET